MKLGHCTNCEKEYEQTFLQNGVPITARGVEVFRIPDQAVLSGNYHEITVALSNGTMTRLSLCTDCFTRQKDILEGAFENLRHFMIEGAKAAGLKSQVMMWQEIQCLDGVSL